MPHDEGTTSRALMVQLARLGDLVQSLPAFVSLTTRYPHRPLDLLCPTILTDLARLFPDVGHVLEWNGARWHAWANSSIGKFQPAWLCEVTQYLTELTNEPYPMAYVWNHHPRAILAGALLAAEVRSPQLHGPLDEA